MSVIVFPEDPLVALLVLGAALALDALLGEPPDALHPVAWMGKLTILLRRIAPRRGEASQLLYGTFVALFVPSLFALAAWLLLDRLRPFPWMSFVASAVCLKSSLALRALGQAGSTVRDALGRGEIGDARFHLRSLCSRDASKLDEPLLVAATVESLAENASDSFVAPIVYYAIFGLPGAVFYRAVNTLDAMIGYHGEYEWLGKAAARLDDLLNLFPARLTTFLILASGWLLGKDARRGWRVWRRDAGKTESPNAGRPMATMAGLLRVELEKVGHYRLGDPIEALAVSKIDEAWRVVACAGLFASALAAVLLGVAHATLR